MSTITTRIIVSLICASILVGCGGVTPPSSQSAATLTGVPTAPSSGSSGVQVTIYPGAIGLARGGTYLFQSVVSGNSNTAVTWSIQEKSMGGTIAPSGAYGSYTAPPNTGSYHVVATSQTDPTQSAVATVNVLAAGFSPAGSLGTARLQHTATLLQDGKVLVAGGGYGPDLIDGYWVAGPSRAAIRPRNCSL